MRARVVAQGLTVVVMMFGAYLGFKPIDRPKSVEEILNSKGKY
jgi:hypothetical protein